MIPPADIIADGNLHRCDADGGSHGRGDGAYLLFLDGIPAGGFQNWRSENGWQNWRADIGRRFSPEEETAYRARIASARTKREEEMTKRQSEAKEKAAQYWADAYPATADHPYLARKRVGSHGLRVARSFWRKGFQNVLLVPMQDFEGEIHSLQAIFPAKVAALGDRDKDFLFGGVKEGHFYLLGTINDSFPLVVATGFATGATIHELTEWPVLVVFDDGNLKIVAIEARHRHPRIDLIIAADNDRHTKGNPGVTKGTSAAKEAGARVMIPHFTSDQAGSDWNDWVALRRDRNDVFDLLVGIFRGGQQNADDVAQSLVGEPYNDIGNAARFLARYRDDVIYVPNLGWHQWDGRRWKRDEGTLQIMLMAQETARLVANEEVFVEPGRIKAVQEWAKISGNGNKLNEMIRQASPHVKVFSDAMEKNPWVLNVENGSLDLRTGKLSSPRREDYNTRLIQVPYNPHANCPLWLDFLNMIMGGDQELVTYLRRAVGYTLTGITNEQCLFFLYGKGKNGKSTFITTLENLMGEYVRNTPFNSLLADDRHAGHGIPNDIARLHGARLITAMEPGEDRRFAESTVKQLTGGDIVTARFLREEFFEFRPLFKIWLAGNHKPVIRGTDEGIWRRIKLIPFLVFIAVDKRDKDLPEKLRPELPGILKWAVDGCMEWQRVGLNDPMAVTNAVEAFRSESDDLKPFLDTCCVIASNFSVKFGNLWAEYQRWCEENKERQLSQTMFGKKLSDRGFENDKDMRDNRIRRGLALQATENRQNYVDCDRDDSTGSTGFDGLRDSFPYAHAGVRTSACAYAGDIAQPVETRRNPSKH
ncbi:MAG: toprim domain-containing protein [Magnetococcales bacterium]|nr:toprim domain-containing protein [Magnetococcales bacterium]